MMQVAVCSFLLAAAPVRGDLGAALRRSAHSSSASLPAAAPLTGPLVIPLTAAGARFSEDGETTFYMGEVSIGQPPQALRVMFDTASGNVLLPHRGCMNATCL